MIEVRDLTKIYRNEEVETRALNGVSFNIEKGEFVAIMGPSGSGKSTLMQILGFLDRYTSGEYVFEGEEVKEFSKNKLAEVRNQKVGFIFQSFNLLPRTTVLENVELPLLYGEKNVSLSHKERQKKAAKALKAVGLEHRMGYFSNQISGGEKQRVAIARALVNDPEIIFADEPTGNLDSKSGLQVMKILQELNSHGHTIILVTHETYTAEHAQRILRMRDGKIISDESVEKRRDANHENVLK
ncbi:MAG: ABC transporter ATP-binding protein [Candidatus Moranbacteria bacterium]|nr:ABC transporter ATP-binding protein [Candidatus Moranbacteria bacterium]